MAFSVDLRKHVPGIWKLNIFFEPPTQEDRGMKIVETLKGNNKQPQKQEVLLKIQEDGSFRQCDEEYAEGYWISGRWKLKNEKSQQLTSANLILAIDRRYFGPAHDKLLTGSFNRQPEKQEEKILSSVGSRDSKKNVSENLIQDTKGKNANKEDNQILCVTGKILIGKFMYPKRHPSFFEDPILANAKESGTFTLQQELTFFKIISKTKQQKEEEEKENCQQSDLYGKTFFLTFVPAKSIPMKPEWDSTLRRYVTPGDDQPVDIRAHGVEFHANNTFTMRATNKILRGRFEIEDKDILFFQVSLFGAGRSIKGSVYSEGPGLNQDDRRAYKGRITKKENGQLSVKGVVTFGSDRKPPEMGRFQLKEVESLAAEVMLDRPDDEDDDSIFDSVFE